jgi:hypothetical protein
MRVERLGDRGRMDRGRDRVVRDFARVPVAQHLDRRRLEVGHAALAEPAADESDRDEELVDVLERRDRVELFELRVVDPVDDDLHCQSPDRVISIGA